MTSVDERGFRVSLQRLPLYLGGFMGPFGTIVIVPMFPELEAEFSASATVVSLGFSLYMIPFAVLLLVSGTLGERWGRRRTIRGTYLLYALASLLCALAPTVTVFILGRALQGVANAFFTPLLVAGLAETVAPDRFGEKLGIYSSFQAIGVGVGPLVGGAAADSDWRWAFWGTLAVSLILAAFPPQGEPRSDAEAPQLRPLLTKRIIVLGIGFLFAAAGPIGISVLVGVAARDVLDLTGSEAGAVLFAGAVSAFVFGPLWGRLLDRFGPRRLGVAATVASIALAAALGFATNGWMLGALWMATSAVVSAVVVVYQAVGASALASNRGGALSFLLSFRFLGHALGPLLFVPGLPSAPKVGFAVAAALGVVTAMALQRYADMRTA